MRLKIAERLRPFSHLPGTSCIIPKSSLKLSIFPALIRVCDLSKALPDSLAEISLNVEGPVCDFTILLDLEKRRLLVWGKSAKGYFRYAIKSLESNQGFALSVEKAPQGTLSFLCKGFWTAEKVEAEQGETVIFGEKTLDATSCLESFERLSLGSHKLQDWELVRRRLSCAEIFPVWHHLGQMVPQFLPETSTGTALLLNECRQAILANAPEKILSKFHKLFLAGFEGVLVPRLADTDHQGIKYQNVDLSDSLHIQGSAITLLSEGAKLIRSLFVQELDQTIYVLPALPPEFHCGRFLDVICGKEGRLAMEWTKKSIRSMTFSAAQNQKLAFIFFNHEKTCRLRHSHKDRGTVYHPGSQIDIIAGQHYWFDNFQR